jgi:hypothetical protein
MDRRLCGHLGVMQQLACRHRAAVMMWMGS